MAGRNAVDALEEGHGLRITGQRKGVNEGVFVETAIGAGDRKQALGHGREGKKAGCAMEEKRSLADVVATCEELLPLGVPDSKGEHAYQVLEASCAPALPGKREHG